MCATSLERESIQDLLLHSSERLDARFLLLRIDDPQGAKAWLHRIRPDVATAAKRMQQVAHVNLAFTWNGLRALGLPQQALDGFGHEFREGMSQASRARALGDVERSDPSGWLWGSRLCCGDVLLMIYAPADELDGYQARLTDSDGGLTVVHELPVGRVAESEHFSFRDGISNPILEGTERAERAKEGREGPDVVRAGEFVLGYRDESDRLPPSPTLEGAPGAAERLPMERDRRRRTTGRRDFGRNGTYLVLRQLEQHVALFWSEMLKRSPDDPERLAAKLVGRWSDGSPLTLWPQRPPERLGDPENEFGYYDEDRYGLRCPVGAHIRRANPRDSLGLGRKLSLLISRRHRILRRSRVYGPRVEGRPDRDDGQERGLLFLCINSDIGRQFEFVQKSWLDSPSFAGLEGERDPLVGSQPAGGGRMTIQACPVRQRIHGLPRFVTVRGGGYFFLPSLAALDYLGQEPAPRA